MSNRAGRVVLPLVAALVAVPMVGGGSAMANPGTRFGAEQITLQDEVAATGMAADTNADRFWVVKDPKRSTLVAIGADGQTRGTLDFGAQVTGLSALAMRDGALFAADFADPSANRQSLTLYRIAEPATGTVSARALQFRYADGPHDSGAVMVSPKGNVYVVTRGDKPGIYRAPLPTDGATATLKRLQDAPPGVSDGVFLSGGDAFALWGSQGLEVRDAYSLERTSIGPNTNDGEAIAQSLDGRSIALAHKGNPVKVEVVQRPSGNATASAAPSSTASQQPQPSASASAGPGTNDSKGSNSATGGIDNSIGGTTWAILAAAGVAVLAGALTLLPGRRRDDRATSSDRPAGH